MNFSRYFKISSYCLIASGFIAVGATGGVGAFWLALFGSAFVASWFIDTARLHTRLPAWVMNGMALVYALLYVIDYRFISRSLVRSTIHLIFFAATVKILTRSRDRDYVYLYLISFAQVLAASTLTVDLTYALSLSLFLASGVSTLILFEMKRSNSRFQSWGRIEPVVIPGPVRGTGLELFSPFPALTLAFSTVAITVLILLVAVPLFFVIPRVGSHVYSRPTGQTRMISGFTERVELGAIGAIKLSDAIVMRVKLPENPPSVPADLKWRGIALDRYDGRAWSRTRTARTPVARDGKYYKVEQSAQGLEFLWQTFLLEALATDVVFAANKPLALSTDLETLNRDAAGGLFTRRHPFTKLRYSALSDVTKPNPALVPDRFVASNRDHRIYLQLPELDPRIAELTGRLTRATVNPYARAAALESYLKSQYGYSLELRGTPNSKDPLAMFLFDVRKGHCEYFASAMAIMLRQVGIPSRLVNGFRTGEYNPLGGSYAVRQYDAHSWVEAFIPPYGWIEFDPTPPDPARGGNAFLKLLWNLGDAVEVWWSEDVINYDLMRQFRLLQSARRTAASWKSALDARMEHLLSRLSQHSTLSGGGLIGIVAAALALIWIMRTGWRPALRHRLARLVMRRRTRSVMVSFYREALELLASRGLSRERGQTPLEFAAALAGQPAAAPFSALTRLYNRHRFGAGQDAAELAAARNLLADLRRALDERGSAASAAGLN